MSNKESLRKSLKALRKAIGPKKRYSASQAALKHFKGLKGMILSFASFGDEIDLWELNRHLEDGGRLILPRVENDQLILYRVDQPLVSSNWNILEPLQSTLNKVPPESINYAFIPGLGFDCVHHRLGYGKGYYDRLIPKLIRAKTIGIGFTDQFLSQPIPIEPQDCGVDELELF